MWEQEYTTVITVLGGIIFVYVVGGLLYFFAKEIKATLEYQRELAAEREMLLEKLRRKRG